MTLHDIIRRAGSPDWSVWSKIPWDDPDFSQRMLENHLSQEHDWASRTRAVIAAQTAFIHRRLPKSAAVLDLGCGPGLYTERLRALGHRCTGVDFSPASIAYAKANAQGSGGPHGNNGAHGNGGANGDSGTGENRETNEDADAQAEYVLADIRGYRPQGPFDVVLLLFGEINVFSREDALAVLARATQSLRPGGLMILEVHTADAVREAGNMPPAWQAHESGLFSDKPHLCLERHFWNEALNASMSRYFVVDAQTATCAEYASCMQAYSENEYETLFREAGLRSVSPVPDADWPTGAVFEDKLRCFACGV